MNQTCRSPGCENVSRGRSRFSKWSLTAQQSNSRKTARGGPDSEACFPSPFSSPFSSGMTSAAGRPRELRRAMMRNVTLSLTNESVLSSLLGRVQAIVDLAAGVAFELLGDETNRRDDGRRVAFRQSHLDGRLRVDRPWIGDGKDLPAGALFAQLPRRRAAPRRGARQASKRRTTKRQAAAFDRSSAAILGISGVWRFLMKGKGKPSLSPEGDSPIFVRPSVAWRPKLGQSPTTIPYPSIVDCGGLRTPHPPCVNRQGRILYCLLAATSQRVGESFDGSGM